MLNKDFEYLASILESGYRILDEKFGTGNISVKVQVNHRYNIPGMKIFILPMSISRSLV
jgi:hypothetical protein